MKQFKLMRVFLFGLLLTGCVTDQSNVKQTSGTSDYSQSKQNVVKTPRFESFNDALEYLGSVLVSRLDADNRAGRGQNTQSQDATPAPKSSSSVPMKIAIADFTNIDGKVSRLGRYVPEKLSPIFARSRQFNVLERSAIDRVIEEQHFQVSPFVDEESTTEFGKILGAETIITGTISEMPGVFYVNAKVVGVTKGNLMASADVEVKSSQQLVTLYRSEVPGTRQTVVKTRTLRAQGVGFKNPNHANPNLARAMAERAARGDAMRNLVQQIQGVQVNSSTTVKDMMAQNDNVQMQLSATLQGARVVDTKHNPDGSVEVEMEVELTEEFLQSLQAQ